MKFPIKISKPKMQARELKLVLATVVVCSLLGMQTLVLKPMRKLGVLTSEISTLQQNGQLTSTLLSQMKVDAAHRASSTNTSEATILEKNNNFSSLLSKLSGDGIEFSLNRLSVAEHKEISGYSRTTFNLEIETDFIELGKFIEGLEKSDFLVDLQSVEIARIDKELKRSIANITLFSYASRGAQ